MQQCPPGQMRWRPTSLPLPLSLSCWLPPKEEATITCSPVRIRTVLFPYSSPTRFTHSIWPAVVWKQTHQICSWICMSFAGPLYGKRWLGRYVGCSFSSFFNSSNKYLWCECTQFVCIQYDVLHIVFFGISVKSLHHTGLEERKVHEYSNVPCATPRCTFHCVKRKQLRWQARCWKVNCVISLCTGYNESFGWLMTVLLYNSITFCSLPCLSFLLIKRAILRPSVIW